MNVRLFLYRRPTLRRILAPLLAVRRALIALRTERFVRAWSRYSDLVSADPVLRLIEFEGEFSVGARSHVARRVMLDGTYEDGLARRWIAFADPNRDVIDVGANVGFYAVLAARHLRRGTVFAIEPNPSACRRLRHNLALNDVESSAVVVQAIATETAGRATLYTVPGLDEYSSAVTPLHPAVGRETPVVLSVEALTIDDLVAENDLDVGLMKVDVEGSELSVLRGASRVLAEHRPVILVEVGTGTRHQSAAANKVFDLLRDHGYELTYPQAPGLPVSTGAFEGVLCVPGERAELQ